MSVLIRLIPFWITGIAAAWLLPSEYLAVTKYFCFILILSLPVPVILNYKKHRTERLANAAVILLCISSSFIITAFRYGNSIVPPDKEIILKGKVVRVWKGENISRVKLKISGYNRNPAGRSGPEYVILMAGDKIEQLPEWGRIIRVRSRFQLIPKKQNTDDFPERLYYAGEGIRKKGWIINFYPDEKEESYKPPLKMRALIIRDKLSSLLENGLPAGECSTVLNAMLLGKKGDMSTDLKDVFRKTGISHLLAVSGLHVGLIYLVFIRLFFFIRKKPWTWLAEIAAIIAVWVYAFITGFGPSVQRAAGMISLFSLSRIMGRRVQPMQVLSLSFFIQTAINPIVIFQLGFQLSYVAVAGILMYHKAWTRMIRTKNKILRKVWDFIGVSVSAQSFTLPFIFLYFNEFPLYFIPGNLLLIPIGLLLFYLGAMYLILLTTGLSLPFFGILIDFITGIMLEMGELIASLPLSLIELNYFSVLHLCAYFLIFFVIVMPCKLTSYRKLRLILFILIIFSLSRFLYVLMSFIIKSH